MRAALGVLVGLAAIAVSIMAFSLAPWFILGVDGVLEPGTFVSTPIYNAYAIAIGVIGGLLGGWIAATIGRSRVAVFVLAALALAMGVGNHMAQHHKPEPGPRHAGVAVMDAATQRKEPDWFTLLTTALGAPAILVGGLLFGRAAGRP